MGHWNKAQLNCGTLELGTIQLRDIGIRPGLEIGHFEKKLKVKKTQLKKKLNNSRKKLKVLANF